VQLPELAGEKVPEPLRGRYVGESIELSRMLQQEVFDECLPLRPPSLQNGALQAAVGTCETFGVPFALPAYTVRLGRAQPVASRAVAIGFLHYVANRVQPEQRVLKRLVDIAGAAAALWVLFPFLLVVSALVKLTSPGTIFFRQLRWAARKEVPHAEVPLDGGRRRGAQGRPRCAERAAGAGLQDEAGSR
jgi:hypothetical protein